MLEVGYIANEHGVYTLHLARDTFRNNYDYCACANEIYTRSSGLQRNCMKGMEKKRLLTSKGKSETQRRGHRKCRGPRRLLTVEPVFLLFCLGWMLHRSVLKQHVFNWYSREQSSDQLNNTALYNISTSTHWPMLMQNTSRNVTLTSAVDKTRHFMISRGAASLLPAVLSTLFFGSLSDKIGYKPIILLSALFGSMTAFVEILAIHMNWSLHVFLVFSALSAVGGSLPLMRTVVFSYVANSSSVRWRTLRFGFLELMVFVGAATNLLTSSVWVQNTEFKFVYLLLVTIGTNVAMAFYAIYVLRTSIEREERDDIVRKYSSSYRHVFRGLVIILKIRSRWRLWSSLVVASVVDFTIYGFVQISGKFLSLPPLAWGQGTITKLSVASETTAILSLMILLPVLVFINIPDTVLVVCGVLWSAICYILMGMSIKSWQVFTSRTYNCSSSHDFYIGT